MDYILEEITKFPEDEIFYKFAEHFQKKFQDSLIAIILYGSTLSPVTRKETSFPDFFVIVDSYHRALRTVKDIILSKIFPPSVYMEVVECKGEKYQSKCNIISYDDLKNSIIYPKDMFVIGRFSKRIAIIFSRSDEVKKEIAYLQYQAMSFCLTYTIPLLEKFTFEELIKEILKLSYKGELRVEAPTKIDELYTAFEDFYKNVYGEIFERYISENEGVLIEEEKGLWKVVGDTLPSKEEVIRFLKKSALYGVLRWPKGLITYKGYKDYLKGKAMRSGEDVKLSPLDEKFPLIFGWRHVIKLVLKGKLKRYE